MISQYAQLLELNFLTPATGTQKWQAGWYVDERSQQTSFYFPQEADECTDVTKLRWWKVMKKSDIKTSNWTSLFAIPILVPVDGTIVGKPGRYRTFFFPLYRGEVN